VRQRQQSEGHWLGSLAGAARALAQKRRTRLPCLAVTPETTSHALPGTEPAPQPLPAAADASQQQQVISRSSGGHCPNAP
jgi:hypothetical protein